MSRLERVAADESHFSLPWRIAKVVAAWMKSHKKVRIGRLLPSLLGMMPSKTSP